MYGAGLISAILGIGSGVLKHADHPILSAMAILPKESRTNAMPSA